VGPALAAGKSLLLISIDGSERQRARPAGAFLSGSIEGTRAAFIHFFTRKAGNRSESGNNFHRKDLVQRHLLVMEMKRNAQ
jgi:hypothetical protein